MKLVEDFVNRFPKRVEKITATYVTVGGFNCTVRIFYSGRVVVEKNKKTFAYNLYNDLDTIQEYITGEKSLK